MEKNRLLIACATEEELRAFVSRLPGGGAAVDALADPTQPGQAPGEAPVIALAPNLCLQPLICGVGPVAPALALGRLLGARGPGFSGLIAAGLAGTYDPVAAPVGSLVLASEECLPEYGVWPEAGEIIKGLTERAGEPAPLPLPQTRVDGREVFCRLDMAPDTALARMGLNCRSDSRKSAFRRGVALTVAGVSGTPGRARRLAALFGGLVENMEGFSLALGAAQARLPCLEVRAVSNEAGFRPPQTWDIPAALEALAGAGAALFAPWLGGLSPNTSCDRSLAKRCFAAKAAKPACGA